MDQLDKKVNELLGFIVRVGKIKPSIAKNEILPILELALKEQDRDTRHAIAEALITYPSETIDENVIFKNTDHNQEIFINGVRYVPAKTVIINAHEILKVLVEQYMGATDDDKVDRLSDELWVVITESPEGYNEPPTVKEIIERMTL